VGQKPKTIPLNNFSLTLFKQIPYKKGARIVQISYKNMRKWFNRYVKLAGIRRNYAVTPHKLRHFFGHYWAKHDGNITTLQKVMRHSKIDHTLIYTEPSEAEIKEEFEAVMKLENPLDKRERQD